MIGINDTEKKMKTMYCPSDFPPSARVLSLNASSAISSNHLPIAEDQANPLYESAFERPRMESSCDGLRKRQQQEQRLQNFVPRSICIANAGAPRTKLHQVYFRILNNGRKDSETDAAKFHLTC